MNCAVPALIFSKGRLLVVICQLLQRYSGSRTSTVTGVSLRLRISILKLSVMVRRARSTLKSLCVRSPTTSNALPRRMSTFSSRGVCLITSSPMNSRLPSASSRWNTRILPAGSGMPRFDALSFTRRT